MSTQELCKRLVDWSEHDEGKINDARHEAKLRIEALTAENERLRAIVKDQGETLAVRFRRIEELGRLARGQGEQLEIQGNELCRRASHGHKQADRIEALTAERDALKQIAADHVLQELEQAARADKAEAKLAKAAEALRFVVSAKGLTDPTEYGYEAIKQARATLAEIEGAKT
jgi:hypothetical protein